MENIKIIVCTTFREFKYTENDEIQKAFLKSLESQSYKNFEVVITLFREQNVETEVRRYKIDSYFYRNEINKNNRYSLTKVVLNAIHHATIKKYDKYILLWTTCDVIYEHNFLETIIKYYNYNMIGTSHPHIIFSSLEDFSKNQNNYKRKSKLSSGFDLIYFDKGFLENEIIRMAIENYVFNDWGVFEHFLIALNELSADAKMINIYEENKVYKIENDRKLTDETSEFLVNSHKKNSMVFDRFLEDTGISREYFDLTYCHLKFDLTTNKIGHYLKFSDDIVRYYIMKFKRKLYTIIPQNVKSLVKSVVKGGMKK